MALLNPPRSLQQRGLGGPGCQSSLQGPSRRCPQLELAGYALQKEKIMLTLQVDFLKSSQMNIQSVTVMPCVCSVAGPCAARDRGVECD